MEYVLGIDVGGTDIKHGLIDSEGTLTRFGSTPTPQGDPYARRLIPTLQGIVEDCQDAGLRAVGVAIPGLVTEHGVVEFSGTLGFRDLDVLSLLAEAIDKPVGLIHDVTAGGLAESRLGAAQGTSCAVLIQIGTGLAASVILNGSVHHPHPAVGEIGHAPTGSDRPCPCGLTGCLEMSASGGAMARNYTSLTGDIVRAQEIFQRASAGEEAALDVVKEFVDSLAMAVVWISSLMGPEVVILSGGLSAAGDRLTGLLGAEIDRRISVHRRPRLAVSHLRESAGCVGAGLHAWNQLA